MTIETKEYKIHDNGGTAFIVKVHANLCIEIRENTCLSDSKEENDNHLTEEPFFSEVVKKVFIGVSPLNKMTEFSGGHGDDFLGNSLLLYRGDLEYVFIGQCVFSFQALSEITCYVSPVGNNDCPYPYAVDIEDRAYLMIEKVIVQLHEEKTIEIPQFNPYSWYYSNKLMTTNYAYNPPREPLVVFHDIKEFRIGDDRYTLTYEPDPENDYDRLMGWNEGNLSISLTDGTNKELSREEYSELMIDFGELMGFQLLERENIRERLW